MLSFIEAALRSGLPLPTGCLYFLHTNRESLEKSERAPYSFTRDGLKSLWRAAAITKKLSHFRCSRVNILDLV